MNWPELISKLLSSGWTQQELADACKCAQSTISDLANGKSKKTSFEIGLKLSTLKPRRKVSKNEAQGA